MTYEDEHVVESDSDIESETETDTELAINVDVEPSVDGSDKRVTRQQYHTELKLSDPDYYVVTKRVGKKMKRIELYSTRSNPGRLIRNPMFGYKSNDRVGTFAERSYFKIRMTSIGDGVEPVTLYYDSPESYEKHLHATVSHEIKTAWRSRFLDN
jgi:hypothetical protein